MNRRTGETDLFEEISKEVDSIIELVFGVDGDEFDDDVELGPEGLGGESLDVVEVAERTEDATGVSIPDEDLEDLYTVGDIKAYVAERSA